MAASDCARATPVLKNDGWLVIGGAGGFIGGSPARYFHDQGFTRIRAIDRKLLPEWYQRLPGVECPCLDLSDEMNCRKACEGAVEVYDLRDRQFPRRGALSRVAGSMRTQTQ